MYLKMGLGEDFGNGKCCGSSIWFFLFPFGGGQEGVRRRRARTLHIEVKNLGKELCMLLSQSISLSRVCCGLQAGICPVCPAVLPISGGLPMLSDGCFPFLSWLCTIILFSMHHQLPVTEQFWAFLAACRIWGWKLEGLIAHSAIRLLARAFVPRACTE